MRTPSSTARRTKCGCGAPVLRQLVGRRAALDVTADANPIPYDQALALKGPNRLVWCLRDIGGGPDLRWLDGADHTACPHGHVVDHQCPAPAKQGGLW